MKFNIKWQHCIFFAALAIGIILGLITGKLVYRMFVWGWIGVLLHLFINHYIPVEKDE